MIAKKYYLTVIDKTSLPVFSVIASYLACTSLYLLLIIIQGF